jgi:acetyl esterase/lipase
MKLEQIRHMPIVYQVPGMDEVHVQKSIPYKNDDGVELSLDVYQPAQSAEDTLLPSVLIIQDGPLRALETYPGKEWKNVTSWARLFAASGLGSVTFNHRFFSTHHLPLAGCDVHDAVHFVHTHAKELSLDPSCLCLLAFWGGSVLISFALREQPRFIKCLVLYSPLLDIRETKRYQKAHPEHIRDAYSPLQCVQAAHHLTLPIFLAKAERATKHLRADIDEFLAEATRRGAPVEVMHHKTGRHAFEIRDDNAQSQAIIKRSIAFIRKHL